jgi:hypothetical protein
MVITISGFSCLTSPRIRASILRCATQCLPYSVSRIQFKELAESLFLFIGQAVIANLVPFKARPDRTKLCVMCMDVGGREGIVLLGVV